MLIALVIILLLIGAAVVGSIYSNFTVFYSNFAESENYHRAYYSSIAALERAELVIKQREPGYVGSGGWILGETEGKGSIQKGGSDGIISSFSYLSNNSSNNNTSSIYWDINSRTTRIPNAGNGDIDYMLATGDSDNYNMMDYKDSQVFLLYYDNGDGNPYNKTSCKDGESCTQSYLSGGVNGIIRLPGKLKGNFDILNTDESLIAGGPKNDAIVDRQIRGRYQNSKIETYPFTIYSAQNYYSGAVYNNYDSAIRESDINGDLNFTFGQNNWSPTSRGSQANFTIISPAETDIKNDNDVKNKHFLGILNEENYKEKQLRFSLLNLLKSKNNTVYPFLEYYIDFGTTVSDKYFTINAEGNYGNYKINKIIWKPTNKESILGSFTTIF